MCLLERAREAEDALLAQRLACEQDEIRSARSSAGKSGGGGEPVYCLEDDVDLHRALSASMMTSDQEELEREALERALQESLRHCAAGATDEAEEREADKEPTAAAAAFAAPPIVRATLVSEPEVVLARSPPPSRLTRWSAVLCCGRCTRDRRGGLVGHGHGV
eukprot:SAG11_NODE_14708_length_602_cov_1.333996_2_plen_163_part_01